MKKDKYLNTLKNLFKKRKEKKDDRKSETKESKSVKKSKNSSISFEELSIKEKKKKFGLSFKFTRIKNIFKKINFKEIKYLKFLVYILIIVFSLIFVFNLIFLFSSIFLVLDGAKTYGISIILLSITVLNYICLFIINRKMNNININSKIYIIIFYVVFALFALGIALSLIQYYKLDMINNVKDKYEMKIYEKDVKLSSDTSKKHYIYFNSWYDNKYIVHYDNELSNIIKIKLEYYECFYNKIITTKTNSTYISLVMDNRDLLSFYIENLRENKIYNAKELSRNVINIYVSEEDYKRIVFVD